MRILFLSIIALQLAVPAEAETELTCEAFTPSARTITISRMQPRRREKTWLEGSPKSILAVSCDERGMKTQAAEYDGKALRRKSSFVYKGKDEARALCEALKSEEKITSTFSGEGRSPLDEFCRRNRKNDFEAVLVYDHPLSGADPAARPSARSGSTREPAQPPGARVLVRQIFRLYNARGFITEELAFDPTRNLETRVVHAYDKDNNLTGTAVTDPEDRQLTRTAYTRNKATASRTRAVHGETDELKEKIVYEYREDGTLRRETRTTFDAGGQTIGRSELYCDARGAYQKELAYDADSPEPAREFNYEYAYDTQGNWTRERKARLIIYNGNRIADTQYAPEITLREIQYYPAAGAK